METLQKCALVLTIIGALNWGLVGLFNFDLVAYLLGENAMFSRTVYVLVALAGILNIGILFNHISR